MVRWISHLSVPESNNHQRKCLRGVKLVPSSPLGIGEYKGKNQSSDRNSNHASRCLAD